MSLAANKYCDARLWKRLKNGEQEALSQIFDQHILLLYSYGHKFTPDRELVEDCIQDLFAEVWEKKERLSDTDSIKFYLFKGLRRRIIRKLNESKMWTQRDLQPDPICFSHEDRIILNQLNQVQIKQLNLALAHLSKRQKEVIYLKFYNRFTYDEIAEVMDINMRTVYNLASQAIASLYKELKPQQDILFPLWWPALVATMLS